MVAQATAKRNDSKEIATGGEATSAVTPVLPVTLLEGTECSVLGGDRKTER